MTTLPPDDGRTQFKGEDFARLDRETADVVAEMCNEYRSSRAILRRAGFGVGGASLVESVRLAVAETGRKWLP